MEWTSETLAEVIVDLRDRGGDSSEIEVKSSAGGVPRLSATLSAFANMPDGGTIILGLDESAGFAPTELGSLAELEQGVVSQARDTVSPPVQCQFQTLYYEGAELLIVHVAGLPLQARPARYGGKAYLRQSDGDYEMSEQEIAHLELLKTQAHSPTRPDRESVLGTSIADLDEGLMARFIGEVRSSSRRYAVLPDDQLLRYTNVLNSDGQLTLAGLYSLGVLPQAASPSLGVTAAVRLSRDDSERRLHDLVHLVGPIPDLLDDATAWVERNTRAVLGYDQRGHGWEEHELPMRAVREIIANALVHRNLDSVTESKGVEIRLMDDRLVISSPGGLWGVSQSQLGHAGGKSAVNPFLYDICKHVRLRDGSRVIEAEGGGIREAIEALRDAGLRAPVFIDKGLQFTVVISRHALLDESDLKWLAEVTKGLDLSSEQRSILASMRRGKEWTNATVRREFAPMDSTDARRLLQGLVATNLVEMDGERGNASYKIVGSTSSAAAHKVVDLGSSHTGGGSLEEPVKVKHADVLLPLMSDPMTFAQLVHESGLNEGQVRYALSKLLENEEVQMRGGRGHRDTVYMVSKS